MEYIINELSLIGQCENVNQFLETILPQYIAVMAEIRNSDSSLRIFKKADLYNSCVAPEVTLHSLVFNKGYQIYDIIRKFKSQLANLIMNGPYWDEVQQQDNRIIYKCLLNDREIDVSGSSVAEAYARGASLVSFKNSDYDTDTILVATHDEHKSIINIYKEGQVLEYLLSSDQLSYDSYIRNAFQNKLDFTKISDREGLNLITNENFTIIASAFQKFEKLTWDQIVVDDGLDYKKFDKNRNTETFFSKEQWNKTIRKFRVNEKIRCFGYQVGRKFYILRIDLDHRLSDLG